METLGSLIDKLTIKNIRLFYLKRKKDKKKIKIVKKQIELIQDEIEGFLSLAIKGKILLVTDEKLKLYNIGIKKQKFKSQLSSLIDSLSQINITLWHLEDEVRRKNMPDSYIVKIKRKIDKNNQIRNDLIDGIDKLLERKIHTNRKK